MRIFSFTLVLLTLVAAGCGGDDDNAPPTPAPPPPATSPAGSSSTAPAPSVRTRRRRRSNSEACEPGVQITVGVSGTGGGFERFCAGETDLSNASRAIEDDEKAACAAKNIEFVEFQVANDALTVVVNPENDWVDCLTVAQLKKIWDTGSKVKSWSDVDPSFPDVSMKLYGAGTDSGTFDYFTDRDQRRGGSKPLRLLRDGGRQRDRAGCVR